MEFSPKRAAVKVKSMLHRAGCAIEHNYNGDRSAWRVKQCWVGKGKYLKRVKLHARGKFGIMHHPSSHVKVLLEEIPPHIMNETHEESLKRKEFEQIYKLLRRHKLYVPLPERQPLRFLHPVWSSKPYKYITSPKWTDSNVILRRKN